MQHPSITLTHLTFGWPDGRRLFADVDATFAVGRTGIVGDNGTGKTTLLRLIAGDLAPISGRVQTTGRVGYLRQDLTLRTGDVVADLLGIASTVAALRRIEAGSVAQADFDAVGDDWDIEARARAALAENGWASVELDRPVGELSGGEATGIALLGHRLASTDVVLLDEPTNNLDLPARDRLMTMVAGWPATLVIVSHDVRLLDQMDATAVLTRGDIETFGGSYSAFREHEATRSAAAERDLRGAEQTLRAEERQRQQAETALARRSRAGARSADSIPKILANARKSRAQESAGRLRSGHDAAIQQARDEVDRLAEVTREDSTIRPVLPDPEVPAGRRILTLDRPDSSPLVVGGRERVALLGRNGIGKSRLLAAALDPHQQEGLAGQPGLRTVTQVHGVRPTLHTGRAGLLPQRIDLPADQSILDTVREAVPQATPHAVRASLARFLFTGSAPDRRVGELSGGERFRVALARLLLAEPAHDLIVLDEPTNNLDLRSIDQLAAALDAYTGTLLVISHDLDFLTRIGVQRWLELDADGLTEVDPPTSTD